MRERFTSAAENRVDTRERQSEYPPICLHEQMVYRRGIQGLLPYPHDPVRAKFLRAPESISYINYFVTKAERITKLEKGFLIGKNYVIGPIVSKRGMVFTDGLFDCTALLATGVDEEGCRHAFLSHQNTSYIASHRGNRLATFTEDFTVRLTQLARHCTHGVHIGIVGGRVGLRNPIHAFMEDLSLKYNDEYEEFHEIASRLAADVAARTSVDITVRTLVAPTNIDDVNATYLDVDTFGNALVTKIGKMSRRLRYRYARHYDPYATACQQSILYNVASHTADVFRFYDKEQMPETDHNEIFRHDDQKSKESV